MKGIGLAVFWAAAGASLVSDFWVFGAAALLGQLLDSARTALGKEGER